MAMHREGLTVKMRLQALDAVGGRCHPDAVMAAPLLARAQPAQSFKTLSVVTQ
jgi:hypothetical protein